MYWLGLRWPSFLSVVVLMLGLQVGFAGTWYVGPKGNDASGDGSRETPWLTIRTATNRVPDDGSTIVLLDGLYEGTQSIGRHFQKRCTVRAENPYRARLRSPADRNRAFYCYDASNVTLQGLEVFGSGGTQGEYVVHVSSAKAHDISFEDCILHDSFNNDLVKINEAAKHILFRGCVIYNQNDRGGDQHFDINTVTDVAVEGCILFNDFAGSGREVKNQSQGFIVIKNSGSTPNVTRRIALRRNVLLNWQGKPDQAFVLLGEDGKPFYEAQEVTIENNLFIHNSPVRLWGTLMLKGGVKDVVYRANTVTGHPNVQWTGGYAAACLRIGENPPIGNILMANNIWCDATGNMPRFTMSLSKHFDPQASQRMQNNLYWNAGKKIPSEPGDMLAPQRDPKQRLADPKLLHQVDDVTLPRWNPAKGQFLSGEKTIGDEFRRLVLRYAALDEGSATIDAADPAAMPSVDILGHPRGTTPDLGCLEQSESGKP